MAAEWCLRQRIAGRRYYDVAAELGVSQSTVHTLVTQALAERQAPAVDQLRQVQTDQLEALIEVLTPHTVKRVRSTLTGEVLHDPVTGQPLTMPDLDVIARLQALVAQLARLHGTEAPTRVQVSRTDVDARVEELADRLSARAHGQPLPVE